MTVSSLSLNNVTYLKLLYNVFAAQLSAKLSYVQISVFT